MKQISEARKPGSQDGLDDVLCCLEQHDSADEEEGGGNYTQSARSLKGAMPCLTLLVAELYLEEPSQLVVSFTWAIHAYHATHAHEITYTARHEHTLHTSYTSHTHRISHVSHTHRMHQIHHT